MTFKKEQLMKKVLVTGANGHLGYTLCKQLLAKGYEVYAGVRDSTNEDKILNLRAISITNFVEFNLTDNATIQKAVKGMDGVFHVAAVFLRWAKNPQKEIIEPTINGALNVVKAAHEAGIKKVIYTSSSVAVGEKNIGRNYSETDWNTATSSPYPIAKTKAEQAVWKFAEDNALNLIAINPSAIWGPNFFKATPSARVAVDLQQGNIPVIPDMSFGLVDVRDVAEAHILAYESETAHGRYILSQEGYTHFAEIGKIISETLPESKVPARRLPSWLEPVIFQLLVTGDWLNYKLRGTPRQITNDAKATIGNHYAMDTSKARTELGWTSRPVKETVQDTVHWIKEQNITV